MTTLAHRLPMHEPRPSLPDTHYVDNRIFTDPAIFDEEMEHIYKRVWCFVGVESEVANPGDYRLVQVAGLPVLLARGQDGTLRAFHNVCRHRGAEIVRDQCGNRKSFQCFYHLWTYALDGTLTGVTLPKEFEASGFKKEEFGLLPVRLETVHGLIFLCLSEETPPLREYLGGMILYIDEHFGPEPLEVFSFTRRTVQSNWKLWQDNNSETYHNMLHPFNRKTVQNAMRHWELFPGAHSVIIPNDRNTPTHRMTNYGEAVGDRDQYTWPGLTANQMFLGHVYPDLSFILRTTILRIDRMIPIGPGETVIEHRGIGLKTDSAEARATRLKHHNELWGPFGRNIPEDHIAVESQYRAMVSGAIRYSIYPREADLRTDDDEVCRRYYRRWGELMGRKAHDPYGELS